MFEYRGVDHLCYAEVTKDDADGYVTGTVKVLAGISEISKTVNSSNEIHWYDNIPAIAISSMGADEITCNVSAIPLEVLADITGQTYDSTKGMLVEGPRTQKYFALGYRTKKHNGEYVYVWRLKGVFSIPDLTSATEDDGTDANGQELVYTGIQTTHRFTSTGASCGGVNVDAGLGLANVATWFDTVKTPDNVQTV